MSDAPYPTLFGRDRCTEPKCRAPVIRGGLCRFHSEQVEGRASVVRRLIAALGSVYAVKSPNGLVKLGFSKQVKRRFVALQSTSPVKLELVGHVSADYEDEQNLHATLKRGRRHNEWFDLSEPRVAEAVDVIASGDAEKFRGWLADNYVTV